MNDIILVSPYIMGHHSSYLKIYASIFLELDCNVTILVPEVKKMKVYLSELFNYDDNSLRVLKLYERKIYKFETEKNNKKGILRDLIETYSAIRNFMDISKSIKTYNLYDSSLVFIMWLDSYVSKFNFPIFHRMIFPYRWAGLFFHPSHIKINHFTKERYVDLLYHIFLFSSNRLKYIGMFDDCIVEKLKKRYNSDVFNLLPDITEKNYPDVDSSLVREILAKSSGRKIVSLLGSLGKRKNVVNFFEVADKCDNENVFYVCAGMFNCHTFTEDELKRINHIAEIRSDKILFHRQHIESDCVFDALFYISDLVVAVYKNFTSSSNVITKAAMYRKYIIVSNEFLMCRIVKQYGIGLCIDYESPMSLLHAVRYYFKNKDKLKGRFSEYIEDHSYESLKRELIPFVERNIKLPEWRSLK